MTKNPGDTNSKTKRPDWSVVAETYGTVLERYFVAKGVDPKTPSTQSTIATNGRLVPKRGDNLVRWLNERTGIDRIEGTRILELGCGFGALATYLAVGRKAALVLGIDVNDDYLDVGRECARRLHCEDVLQFEHADMRSLGELSDRPFDIASANNSLLYITSASDVSKALAEVYEALRPGGAIVVHQANRWQWREPFTKDPLVHMLPAPAARGVSKLTGWKHNHGRVRLLSPPELRRKLKRAGFQNVRLSGVGVAERGLKRYVSRYIVATGQRPATS